MEAAPAKNLSVSQLVCVGVSTSQCVDLTARDAADRGYDVVIVEDAVAEDSPEHYEATLEQFERLFRQVMTAKEVIKELRRAIENRDNGETIMKCGRVGDFAESFRALAEY